MLTALLIIAGIVLGLLIGAAVVWFVVFRGITPRLPW